MSQVEGAVTVLQLLQVGLLLTTRHKVFTPLFDTIKRISNRNQIPVTRKNLRQAWMRKTVDKLYKRVWVFTCLLVLFLFETK